MALTDITRSEVLQAVAEFDRLGRDAFLRRYGFGRARRYLLLFDGKEYDSKAVVGAAHGFLPGHEPLGAGDFSGGQAHTVKLLCGLGFHVVSEPSGSETDRDGLIARIEALRVAHTPDGPRLYQPIALLWAIGRAARDEPRVLSWAATEEALRDLLARHGLRGERPRPDYPIAALHHAGLWTIEGNPGPVPPAHGDSALKRWFAEQQPSGGLDAGVHEAVRRSGQIRVALIETLVARFFDGLDETALLEDVGLYDDTVADDAEAAFAASVDPVVMAAQYERWCALVERREHSTRGRTREQVSRDPIRSGAARMAVLSRSQGRCENPACQRTSRTSGLPSSKSTTSMRYPRAAATTRAG
jgi:5-methylcytosine-specific restriction protein A